MTVRLQIVNRHLYQKPCFIVVGSAVLPSNITLSTGLKRAIYQIFAIVSGMRLGAFFLGWLCAKRYVNQAAILSVLCSFTTEAA